MEARAPQTRLLPLRLQLTSVPDQRQQDQPDKRLGNVELLAGLVDRRDENVGAEGSKNGDGEQGEARRPEAHRGLLRLLVRLLGEEEVGVGFELEVEVGEVDDEEDDGGPPAERDGERTSVSSRATRGLEKRKTM